MLQIVNLQLPPHLQLNLTEESLHDQTPIQSLQGSQTRDKPCIASASQSPTTDTRSPSVSVPSPPTAAQADDTHVAVVGLPPSPTVRSYCGDEDEDFVPENLEYSGEGFVVRG